MLLHLKIENYGLIENIEIDFNNGFTILTGETGAGKSIILGALSLLQGDRFDTEVIKNKEKKCLVEGVFNLKKLKLESLFAQNDIDYFDETIIRREVGSNGKSRAFINDIPVNLNLIKELSERLIDIHSQHENLLLKNKDFQLNIIDIYSVNYENIKKYQVVFYKYNNILSKYNKIKIDYNKDLSDLDFYNFQYNQLYSIKLNENELIELENEHDILINAEEIKSQLLKSSLNLNGEEDSVLIRIKDSITSFNSISKFFSYSKELKERLTSIEIELKDICSEIDIKLESVEYNHERFELIKSRIDLIYNLFHKHNANTITELITIMNDMKSKICAIESREYEIENLEKEIQTLKLELIHHAKLLHKTRIDNKFKLENSIKELCNKLGMPNAKLIIQISEIESFNEFGNSDIHFLFSANSKIAPANIEKIASGGEISRLMLILKSLTADKNNISTIVFDEIDTGVSGEIAYKMGEILKQISKNIQLISITHLPQIASKGDYHYLVYKTDSETRLKKLNTEERVFEIAKLLSGKEITESSILNAKELLSV